MSAQIGICINDSQKSVAAKEKGSNLNPDVNKI